VFFFSQLKQQQDSTYKITQLYIFISTNKKPQMSSEEVNHGKIVLGMPWMMKHISSFVITRDELIRRHGTRFRSCLRDIRAWNHRQFFNLIPELIEEQYQEYLNSDEYRLEHVHGGSVEDMYGDEVYGLGVRDEFGGY